MEVSSKAIVVISAKCLLGCVNVIYNEPPLDKSVNLFFKGEMRLGISGGHRETLNENPPTAFAAWTGHYLIRVPAAADMYQIRGESLLCWRGASRRA